MRGLVGDLTSVMVACWQELEADRTRLMEDVTANKRKMSELEDNLLYKLTSTKVSWDVAGLGLLSGVTIWRVHQELRHI